MTCKFTVMTSIVFYEKPGCINNARQKRMLLDAGHDVECRNLLTAHWEAGELRSYFGNLPVVHWFNTSAPAIQNGVVVPSDINESQALALMLEDPLLIRRPLIRVGEKRWTGFDVSYINEWIGLGAGFDTGVKANEPVLGKCQRTDGRSCEANSYKQV